MIKNLLIKRHGMVIDHKQPFLCVTFVFIFIVILSTHSYSEVRFKYKTYKIPNSGMFPTLRIGDQIYVKPYEQNENPKRGDIIAFRFPEDTSKIFIHRVIAIGGDTIESRSKLIYINGRKLNEPYVNYKDKSVTDRKDRDNFGPISIPGNKFFVMGDDRDGTYDSRFWGLVDLSLVMGKVIKK